MGTHPIFESDFDCLTEIAKMRIAEFFIPACLGSVSMKFFEMQSEHAEAHLLGVTQKVLREFKTFETKYQKIYSFDERKKRAQIFQENFMMIEEHNSESSKTWTMEINEHADMNFEEFRNARLMVGQDCSATNTKKIDHVDLLDLPEWVDWRERGGVSPVKNQGHCGSCWTFSTTGCLESAHLIHHQKAFNLSEQQLVDCAQDFDNHGCNGGLPSHAFEYIHYIGGLEEESDYHYEAKDGLCEFNPSLAKATVREVFNITEGDEDQLAIAISYFNPVSIAFEVVDDFRFYKEGVYSSDTCKAGPYDVNHAVLAVGFGTCKKFGTPFWIVKNSWGAEWGDEGFFKIERGVNMCGVATCPSFPIV